MTERVITESDPTGTLSGCRLQARRLCGAPFLGMAALVALVFAGSGCRPGTKPTDAADPTVVAEVGDRKITADDLMEEARLRSGGRRAVPSKEELLVEMVEREAMLQWARKNGVDRIPAIQREVENVLLRHLLVTELEPRREAVMVGTNEVEAEFAAHPERYARPAQVRFAMLYRSAGPKATPEKREEIRGRLKQAAERAASSTLADRGSGGVPGFGALAAEASEDQVSRYRGGDIGWLGEGQVPARIPARVIEAGWKLNPGSVSGVLEEADGFYVIMKTDSRGPGRTSFAAVEPTLRQSLLVQKRKEVDRTYRAEIAQRFPARIHTNVLETLTLPEAANALTASNRQSHPPALPGTTDSPHGN